MSLSGLHTNYDHTSYQEERDHLLKLAENVRAARVRDDAASVGVVLRPG